MSHFYGFLQGGRGSVTRTGHKTSGITACLQTRTAKLVTRLWHSTDGKDMFRIEHVGKHGKHTEIASGELKS